MPPKPDKSRRHGDYPDASRGERDQRAIYFAATPRQRNGQYTLDVG
jgi:hypothetical protein